MYFAIAGNIGSGKTTLTKLLCEHYKWSPNFEEINKNPYLEDFYKDMPKWAFHLQVSFLKSRFEQISKIIQNQEKTIQDRTIFEDAEIFATNLNEMGLMSSRDFQSYLELYKIMLQHIKPPDLLIYLKASVPKLFEHIYKRGREYETSINLNYLSKLNDKYNNWIQNYNHGEVLIINVDELNFEEKPEDLGEIILKIDAKVGGLF